MDYLATLTVVEQGAYILVSLGLTIEYFVRAFRTGDVFSKLVGLLYPANIVVGTQFWRAAEQQFSGAAPLSVMNLTALTISPVLLLLIKIEYMRRTGIGRFKPP